MRCTSRQQVQAPRTIQEEAAKYLSDTDIFDDPLEAWEVSCIHSNFSVLY